MGAHLVTRLCLGTHCPRGSASKIVAQGEGDGRRSLPGGALPGGAW